MKKLINTTEIPVRFSEVDSLRIIWHGNYVQYLEEGREAFGKQFGIDYYSILSEGFVVPIVKVDLDYKKMVQYGDTIVIETEFVNEVAAKLTFIYRIYRKSDMELVATAKTIQVFLDKEEQMLQLTIPEFFEKWKKQCGII